MKKMLVVGALAVALVGCASVVNNDEYNQLASQADNEIKLADKAGFLWTGTEKLMKESRQAKASADQALDAGDKAKAKTEFDIAMKLANKAMKEAQLAQQQARDNANPMVNYH
jgi:uncharacterized protein YceK